jgi:HAD superfamily hydrolase (TIGR01484 family)
MDHTIPHKDIKLIVLDLDGTLLNSKKELSPGNFAALEAAAAKGIYVVPCTGRFFKAMPECIRSLPFLRYAITINGAQVFDRETGEAIVRDEIALERVDLVVTALHHVRIDLVVHERDQHVLIVRPVEHGGVPGRRHPLADPP